MKWKIIILLISFLHNPKTNDTDLEIIIHSIIQDGFSCSHIYGREDYINCIENIYQSLEISAISETEGTFNIDGTRYFGYSIKAFEVSFLEKRWIIMKYTGEASSGWYRLYGYRENDFKVFYSYVMQRASKKKKTKDRLLQELQENLPVLSKINFECLVSSIAKNKYTNDCLISNTKKLAIEGIVISGGPDALQKYLSEQNLNQYGRFTEVPFIGTIPPRKS